MKRVSILLCAVLLMFSCRKKDPLFDGLDCYGNCYILEGKLIEKQTGNGMKEIELKFFFKPQSFIFDQTQYLGRTFTRSDGSYSFKFDGNAYKDGRGYFLIQGFKEGYIKQVYSKNVLKDLLILDLDSTKFNVVQTNDLELYKATNLTLRVRATTVTNFQFLTVSYAYGNNGQGQVLNGGNPIDRTFQYKTAADWPTIIQYDATGNGVNITRKETIIVPAQDGNYEINL